MDDAELRHAIGRLILDHSRVGMPIGEIVQRLAKNDDVMARRVMIMCHRMAGEGTLYWRNRRHPNRLKVADPKSFSNIVGRDIGNVQLILTTEEGGD